MIFNTKLHLPLLNQEIRYSTLKNELYIELLKFITNNDDDGVANYFDFILSVCVNDQKMVKRLSNVEKFLILMDIRSISLGDSLEFLIENKEIKYNIVFIKNNILKQLKNILDLNNKFTYDQIGIEFGLPSSLKIDSLDSIYREVIKKIEIDGHVENFYDLDTISKDKIESMLPAKFTDDLFNYINETKKSIKELNIITGKEKLGVDTIPLNFYDNTMYMFLKTIYGSNLLNMYELEYNMTCKLGLSYERFIKMTPNECKLFINFYNRDKKQEEEQSKASNPNISIPKHPNLKN